MNFEIVAWREQDQAIRKFYYDNEKNILKDENGVVFNDPQEQKRREPMHKEAQSFDKNNPVIKSKKINKIKIQLGLSCNYTCEYCSQRFLERPYETSKKDIDSFIEKLNVLEFDEQDGLSIEFWGGEPLVYWKTIKPLAEALVKKFASWKVKPKLSMVTNGSLLTKEICAWLYFMGFSVSMSHDGPGQFLRGPDPFDDPEKKKIILDFYNIMKSKNGMSFNAMLTKQNSSRKDVYDWFVNLTGDPGVMIGEGGIVDLYNETTKDTMLDTFEDHFKFRKKAFSEIYQYESGLNFIVTYNKINGFIGDVLSHTASKYVTQKCSMDSENIITVDLKGNVLTCQNVSSADISHNGNSHCIGTLDDYNEVALNTATHWSKRPNCSSCPVLHVCKGSCMFLDGEYWDISCNNAYSDNVVLFCAAIYKMTGFVPVEIIGGNLPDDRRDIWGDLIKHEEKPKRKIIPIKAVTEKIIVEDIEVYTKTIVEQQ